MRKKQKGKKKVDQREPIYVDLGPCFMPKVISHTESDGMEWSVRWRSEKEESFPVSRSSPEIIRQVEVPTSG